MITQHPDREQILLENVLSALGNPLRLRIVRILARGGERTCGSILDGVSKSTLTHHWRVLRDSGVIWQRPSGRENLLSLRREDLDARFPGLLDALLQAAEANDHDPEPVTARYIEQYAWFPHLSPPQACLGSNEQGRSSRRRQIWIVRPTHQTRPSTGSRTVEPSPTCAIS